MKQTLLAVGATLLLSVPALASPDFGKEPAGKNGYYFLREVTGKVINESGKPLAGVTVSAKGSTRNTTTGVDGRFTITVADDETALIFSYIGMEAQEFKLGASNNIQVSLKMLDNSLNDVVVVGYGTQKKEHLTGAIASIDAKEIEDLPVSSVGAALQGRILGLGVSGGTSRPGNPASLTIRNPVSLSKDGGNNSPLFVIDGIIQLNSSGGNDDTWFNNLDASEIENISILKDASAAVYGARGANGVVLVTTKRGKSGAPKISYSGSYGINDEAYRTKMMSAYEFAQYMNIMNGPNGANAQPGVNNFFSQDELDHFKTINYDWLEPAWRSAHNMRHTLNASGGTDRATYFANVAYYTQDGNLGSLDYKKWTFRSGADVNVLAGLKTGLQVAGSWSNKVKTFNKIGGENEENDYRNLLLSPRYVPMYVDGMPVRLPGTDAYSQYHFYEIQRLANLAKDNEKAMTINMYVEYEVPFIKGLKARANYARNFFGNTGSQVGTRYELYEFNRTGENQHIYDKGATVSKSSTFKNGDRLYYSNSNSESEQLNFTLNYARQFGKHNISGLFSMERAEASSQQQDVWKETPLATTNGQFGSAFGAIDGRTSGAETGTLGYIGRANYSYADKYLAEFLFRTDASTKFAPEHYWGRFYSLSGGWIISNENFFHIPAINFLKVRYSTGLLGKDDTRPWQWRQRYTYQNGKGAVFGGNSSASTGMKMEASPNRNATWSDEWKNNFGVDARFLNNRLSATVEAFYNKGSNMLIEKTESVPTTVGGTIAAENWAKIDFFGYELGLGWNDKVGKDFNYGVELRFGWNDNKILQGNFSSTAHLYPWEAQAGKSSDIGVWGYDYLGMFKSQEEITSYVSKNNITSVFGTAAANLKPGMLYYNDVRGALQADGTFAAPDGIIDANDQVQLAKKSNNHYGFSSVLKGGYKGVSFDFVISGSFGGWSEIDNTSRKKLNNNISRNYQNRPSYWGSIYDPLLNPAGIYPNPHWEDINLNPRSDFWQTSGFRLAMRNARVSYALSKNVAQALHISSARVNLTVLNPVILFNPFSYKAPDGSYDVFPMLRTYSLGVNLSL